MKVTIRDPKALQALDPENLVAYLRSRHWFLADEPDDKASIWVYEQAEQQEHELLLPLNPALLDYPIRVSEVLATLEQIEKRSQEEIYADITSANSDVIRVLGKHPRSEDGTIPLKGGAEFYRSVYEMLLSSASSAANPQAHFSGKRPKKARDYVESTAQLGQSEQGSYVIVVFSGLLDPESRTLPLFENSSDRQIVPFGRLTLEMLVRGLNTINQLANSLINHQGSFEIDADIADSGVSANLCEAVVRTIKALQNSDLEIEFTWSAVHPISENTPTKVQISVDLLEAIEQIAEQLKGSIVEREFGIIGAIVSLRGEVGEAGTVTIRPLEWDERQPTLRIRLDAEDYALASQAHAERRLIRCRGDLIRRGRTVVMENVEHFTVSA